MQRPVAHELGRRRLGLGRFGVNVVGNRKRPVAAQLAGRKSVKLRKRACCPIYATVFRLELADERGGCVVGEDAGNKHAFNRTNGIGSKYSSVVYVSRACR